VNIVVEESGDSSFAGLFGVLENAVVRNLAVDVEHEQGESGSLAVLNIPERVEYLGLP